jgi:putative serine protease PepD
VPAQKEDFMTTPMTPAGLPEADQASLAHPTPYYSAPAPKKSRLGAAVIGGAAVTALLGGAVGGAIGYAATSNNSSDAVATASVDAGSVGANLATATGNFVVDLAAAVQPAVVQLDVSGTDGAGTGSGFVISPDGYIVTNNHVAGPAGMDGSINVTFADGKTATGKLVGTSPDYDLAVVKVDRTGLQSLPMGVSRDLKVGQSVIAIGSPLGLQGTVTTGIVSALDRPVTAGEAQGDTSFINAIQTDAAINPGNSGGPLINASGEAIGVNSAIASMGSSAGQAGSIGLGFAIPIDTVKRISNELIKNGSASTPVIGVQLDTGYTGEGAKVGEITSGGAAEAAGMQSGDVITKIDGKKVVDSTALVVAIRSNAPGDTITLIVVRDGDQVITLPLTLKSAPKS